VGGKATCSSTERRSKRRGNGSRTATSRETEGLVDAHIPVVRSMTTLCLAVPSNTLLSFCRLPWKMAALVEVEAIIWEGTVAEFLVMTETRLGERMGVMGPGGMEVVVSHRETEALISLLEKMTRSWDNSMRREGFVAARGGRPRAPNRLGVVRVEVSWFEVGAMVHYRRESSFTVNVRRDRLERPDNWDRLERAGHGEEEADA